MHRLLLLQDQKLVFSFMFLGWLWCPLRWFRSWGVPEGYVSAVWWAHRFCFKIGSQFLEFRYLNLLWCTLWRTGGRLVVKSILATCFFFFFRLFIWAQMWEEKVFHNFFWGFRASSGCQVFETILGGHSRWSLRFWLNLRYSCMRFVVDFLVLI